MKMLKCQNCGSALAWDGASPVVECQYCGMRYQMHVQAPSRDPMQAALEGGCVRERPVLSGSDYGICHYISWLPQGWTYQVDIPDMNRYGLSVGTPLVPRICMASPDRGAWISHVTSNCYIDQGAAGSAMGGFAQATGGLFGGFMQQLGGAGFAQQSVEPSRLDTFTYTRYRSIVSAEQYCDELLALDGRLQNPQLVRVDQPDDIMQANLQKLRATAPPDMIGSLWHDWARRVYAGYVNGRPYRMAIEAQITSNGFNVADAQRQQQSQQQGGGFLSGLLGQMKQGLASATQMRYWQTDYEEIFAAPDEQFDALFPEFDNVRRSIEMGPDFEPYKQKIRAHIIQTQQQTQNTVNNAFAQMEADRNASWDRRRAILQDAHNATMNTMRAMNANTEATNQRVANMHQEMVREQNVYYGTDGRLVQADIGYDHVYQYQPDQDWFVGVEGDWLQPGVDFTELGRADGRY